MNTRSRSHADSRATDTPLGGTTRQHAGRVPPQRFGGGVQISARQSDISQHVVVEFGKIRELAAMFDGENQPPDSQRQGRDYVAGRRETRRRAVLSRYGLRGRRSLLGLDRT
jgi:hypothetical protein